VGGAGEEARVGQERPLAFDVERFEPPFERVQLREAFVQAHGLRRVVVHEDANTGDAQLVDVAVTTFDYDRRGRLLKASTLDRGVPGKQMEREYMDDQLAVEIRVTPDGDVLAIVYTHDAEGRVLRIEHELSKEGFGEERSYDEHGRLDRVSRIEGGRRSEQSFVYAGERLRRTVLRLPEGREIVTEHSYSANGRPTRWVRTDSSKGGVRVVDTYEFTWDALGQLRTLSFTEGDVPIYRRTYAYDEDGRPLREQLDSFVPAMGQGSVVRYEYERHDELPRQATVASATPGPSAEPSKAKLLEATLATFRGAYGDLALVTFQAVGNDDFMPDSVTVYIPEAIVRKQSKKELDQLACEAKQVLGMACACQWVTLGKASTMAWHSWPDKRVVPLTLHFGIAC
jgi:hypothetical protein